MKDNKEAKIFKRSVYYTFGFIFIIWLVKALEWGTNLDLGFLGVYPRTFYGTVGIFFAPLIHGNLFHLLSNTFPLILLGVGVFYFYNKIAKEVFLWIYFLTGFFVWIIAREAYHIGASGIVYGLVSFLFISGILRKESRSIAISLIILILYRGMIYGLIPGDGGISWESHLMGATVGLAAAVYFRNVPVDPVMKIVLPENESEKLQETGSSKNQKPVQYHFTPTKRADNTIQYPLKLKNPHDFSDPDIC